MSIQTCVFFIVTIYVSVSCGSSEQDLLPLAANSSPGANSTEPTLNPSVQGQILAKEEFPEPTPPPSPPPPLVEFRKLPQQPTHSFLLDEVVITPILPSLKPVEILNRASIRIEGFDHIHRRTVKHVTKGVEEETPSLPASIETVQSEPQPKPASLSASSSVQVDHVHRRSAEHETVNVVQDEEFLPVEHRPKRLSAVEEFDLAPPEIGDDSSGSDSESGSGSGDGEDTSILVRSAIKKNGSDVPLIRGSGLLYGSFKLLNNESDGSSEMSSNHDERVGVDSLFDIAGPPRVSSQDEQWWMKLWSETPGEEQSSVVDKDVAEESAKEHKITVISTEEKNVKSDDKILSPSFTTMIPITEDEIPTARPKEQSPGRQGLSVSQSSFSHVRPNSSSSNSTGSRFQGPLVYILRSDGPLAQFINKHAAVLVGIMMAIPAMIILLYFIHLRRRRGYTGSLYVSPTSANLLKKKSRNGVTFCSYENEISIAPSTSSTPPKPPPLPTK